MANLEALKQKYQPVIDFATGRGVARKTSTSRTRSC